MRRSISFKVCTTTHRQKKLSATTIYQNRRCLKFDGKKKALKKSRCRFSYTQFVCVCLTLDVPWKYQNYSKWLVLIDKTNVRVLTISLIRIQQCTIIVCWTCHRQRPSRSSTHFMIRPTGTWSTANSKCSKYNKKKLKIFFLHVETFKKAWNSIGNFFKCQSLGKNPVLETNYGGMVYSSSDAVETIAGHVLKSPKPLMAQHGQRHRQQQSTDSIRVGDGIDDNRIQRQSGFLVKRLDAKKSMAEISIPVRIKCIYYTRRDWSLFFRYLLHGFPIWMVSISNDAFLRFLSFSSALILFGVSLSRECEPCLDCAHRWFVESSGFSF
jgi:hypothetical protein